MVRVEVDVVATLDRAFKKSFIKVLVKDTTDSILHSGSPGRWAMADAPSSPQAERIRQTASQPASVSLNAIPTNHPPLTTLNHSLLSPSTHFAINQIVYGESSFVSQ